MEPYTQIAQMTDPFLDEDENWNDDMSEEYDFDDIYAELPFESSYEF